MALKFFIVFLIYISVSVIVESRPSAKNEQKSDLKNTNRDPKQFNYIYYPYYGYQSFYQNSVQQRPTKQPHRRSTTTQRYSIWQLSRKRRSAELDNESGDTETSQHHSDGIRPKRQIDAYDVNYDYYPYNLRQLFGRRQNYPETRNQRYSMWDLTRRKRNVLDKVNKSKLQ